MNKLKDRVAIVTGAGGVGVGRAVALLYAAEGAKVVCVDVNQAGVDKIVEEITASGGSAIPCPIGINTLEGCGQIVQCAVDNYGRVDIIANCAAVNCEHTATTDLSEKEWDFIMDVNVKGYFGLVRAALPYMYKQNYGRILGFSSRAAFDTRRNHNVAYSASKASMIGFTIALSAELAPHGVTINCIVPSAVTGLFPIHRPRFGGGPTLSGEYVAPMLGYLATEEAGSITGKFFYASSGDIIVYALPMQLPGPHMFARKANGNWTIEELIETVPDLIKGE